MATEAKEMPPESIVRHKPQQLSGGMYLKDRQPYSLNAACACTRQASRKLHNNIT